MDAEIVLAVHALVHHELQTHAGAFARLEDHRTDGRCRRSAPLHDFDIGRLTQLQGLVADIGKQE